MAKEKNPFREIFNDGKISIHIITDYDIRVEILSSGISMRMDRSAIEKGELQFATNDNLEPIEASPRSNYRRWRLSLRSSE